jgi:hypothetical protein
MQAKRGYAVTVVRPEKLNIASPKASFANYRFELARRLQSCCAHMLRTNTEI